MTNLSTASQSRSEINVTPLIDVLLVLLIIFMVITPLTPHGLDAEIPQQSTADSARPETPVVLELAADGSLHVNTQQIKAVDLPATLAGIFSTRADKTLFLKADRNLEYRYVATAIDIVRGVDPSIQVGLMHLNR